MLSRLRELVFKNSTPKACLTPYREFATNEPLGPIDDDHATKNETSGQSE